MKSNFFFLLIRPSGVGRSRTIRESTGKAGDHKQKAKRKGLEGGGKKIRKKGRRGVLCCW